MDAKPQSEKPAEGPNPPADQAAKAPASDPKAKTLVPDALPEPERVERENDLA